MTELRAYEDFTAKPLRFPIGGKVYELPPLSIESGITLATLLDPNVEEGKELPANGLWQLLLGSLWDVLLADHVPADAVTRIGLTALADYQYGRDMAEVTWEAGANPKALALGLMARQKRSQDSLPSPSTGTETETPSPEPTKATTSPQP